MGMEPSHLTMKEEASWFLLSKAAHALEWTTLSLNEKGKVKKNLIIIIIILSDCLLVGSCEGHIYSSGVTDGGVRLGRAVKGTRHGREIALIRKTTQGGLGSFSSLFFFFLPKAIGRCGESDGKWE